MPILHPLVSLLAVAVLVATHILAGRLRFLEGVPRSRWLSFAGGVSVAYVFVHLLPDLAAHQHLLGEHGLGEHAVFVVALAGLATYYGLERVALRARPSEKHAQDDALDGTGDEPEPGIFFVHLGAFALYNLLVGYLLVHREDPTLAGLALYTTAMSLHFLVNDFGLRDLYQQDYRWPGRWLLAGAALAGWGIGVVTTVGEHVTGYLFAFLAGGIVLNVLKEELPENRQSRFWAFAIGAIAYSTLLLAIG